MSYADNVFINCPFDAQFAPLNNAIFFSIFDCGFVPRCALELGNGNNVRFENIKKLIYESDIAGQDIRAHGGQEATVIKHVRNWLASESKRKNIPGGEHIGGRYAQFKVDLPEICRKALITSVDP
jgi:hypothetical protein